ncbi:VWA domain-containing protein [Pseudomonas sp. OIL-1]|uniref:VWA domain-containing protein n=1 Tax=Pseudomonas sp. OIL-1 TaxID=2706126 RepID=UPI0013A79EE3|nr:VWA domain-containing protein [Pseudomonas sp. OIL-1]QIB52537.1 VWA domain-containing protein [Pseudomonas sp. OIL-1]
MWLESLTGFSFSRPVWLLALLPALALCWLAFQHAYRGSGWESVLPVHLQRWLLRRSPGGANRRRFLLLACCWVMAILALAGPSREITTPSVPQAQPSVLIVLDVSHNMLSDDLRPTRLTRAKRKIRDILALPDDYQVGLIAYAGSAHRVTPLSNDPATLTSLLQALEPAIMPSSGRDLDQALQLARDSISELPRTTRVLLLTSGASDTELAALDQHAEALGEQLAVLGAGTLEGAPVALEQGGFMRDDQGRIVLPRLNARELASTVRRHGASYQGMTLDNRDLQRLLSAARPSSEAGNGEPGRSIQDYGAWLALLLLPLAALGARRGWLGLLLCVALLPAPAEADWADYWQRPDQQGAALLEQQQPEAAAEQFEDPAWRAWAWYQAGDYPQATEAYAEQLNRQPEDADSHFNYGTALAMSGRYPEALEAFEQALTRVPEHHPARHNRDRIEALLEEQQRQQAEQENDSEAGKENPGDPAEPAPNQAQSSEIPQPPPADTRGDEDVRNGQSAPSAGTGNDAGTTFDAQQGDSSSAPQGNQSDNGAPGETNASATSPDRIHNEQQQALGQWLEAIPDEPAELLRRKFLYQYQQGKEAQP